MSMYMFLPSVVLTLQYFLIPTQVLVAEAQAHEDKVRELNETVEKLKELCDPQQVKERAANVTELHKGMIIMIK